MYRSFSYRHICIMVLTSRLQAPNWSYVYFPFDVIIIIPRSIEFDGSYVRTAYCNSFPLSVNDPRGQFLILWFLHHRQNEYHGQFLIWWFLHHNCTAAVQRPNLHLPASRWHYHVVNVVMTMVTQHIPTMTKSHHGGEMSVMMKVGMRQCQKPTRHHTLWWIWF